MTDINRIPEDNIGIVERKYYHYYDFLSLESTEKLGPITLAYETYGSLNADRTNAILVEHALSGDSHAAGYYASDIIEGDILKESAKPGWWDTMIGPGKGLDTDKYFIVCSNIIGGCQGSTGPGSINPATGRHYGLDFPLITIGDMVNAQMLLMEFFNINKWYAVIGGSMGGMQALQWGVAYPDFVENCIPIATTHRLNAQNIAFDAVGRAAIMSDPNWKEGNYYEGESPANGLSVARMVAHITYLSEESMHNKFARKLRSSAAYNWNFKPEFSVETYLHYQGDSFVKRFDANSYLYITKAMDYYDLGAVYGTLSKALNRATAKFLVISVSSDWLFPTSQSREIVRALRVNDKDVSFVEIQSGAGHDAFLLEVDEITSLICGFLGMECKERVK